MASFTSITGGRHSVVESFRPLHAAAAPARLAGRSTVERRLPSTLVQEPRIDGTKLTGARGAARRP